MDLPTVWGASSVRKGADWWVHPRVGAAPHAGPPLSRGPPGSRGRALRGWAQGAGQPPGVPSRPPLSVVSRLGLGLLSVPLLALSFPDADQGWLAWVALVPLIGACRGSPLKTAFLLGSAWGAAAAVLLFSWIFTLPEFRWYHGLILAAYLGAYLGLWCTALAWLTRSRRAVVFAAPAFWVALDYLKAHAGFLSAPWASLAHSQHADLAVLQIASLTGEYGVTFLVVMANVALAELWMAPRRWRAPACALAAVALVHLWGAWVLAGASGSPRLRVAAVQPSIPLTLTKNQTGLAARVQRLERLTMRAAAVQPDLIVWPETALRDLAIHPVLARRVADLARRSGASLVAGASEFVKFQPGATAFRPGARSYNAAYLVTPDGAFSRPYRKMRLVPFGEYLPLEGGMPWPAWLVPGVLKVLPGDRRLTWTLPGGLQILPLICWENLFPDFVRRGVQRGARVIVQLTNDNWFGRSAAPRQHNLASVLRAVENRRPVVIASNTGPSQIIGPRGRVLAESGELFTQDVIGAVVPVGPPGQTVYTRFGDIFVLLVFAWLMAVVWWRPRAFSAWRARWSESRKRGVERTPAQDLFEEVP